MVVVFKLETGPDTAGYHKKCWDQILPGIAEICSNAISAVFQCVPTFSLVKRMQFVDIVLSWYYPKDVVASSC
jgi:hypothetical protein